MIDLGLIEMFVSKKLELEMLNSIRWGLKVESSKINIWSLELPVLIFGITFPICQIDWSSRHTR